MPIYAWKEMWEAYKSSLISVWHKDMDRCSCRHPCIFTDARSKNKGKKPNQSQSVKSTPSETPEDIRQVSVSFLGVVIRLWPGLLIKQNQMDQFQKHRAFFLKKKKKRKSYLPPIKIELQIRFREWNPRRTSVDYTANASSMRFSKGGNSKVSPVWASSSLYLCQFREAKTHKAYYFESI